jgi:hypothetical protein
VRKSVPCAWPALEEFAVELGVRTRDTALSTSDTGPDFPGLASCSPRPRFHALAVSCGLELSSLVHRLFVAFISSISCPRLSCSPLPLPRHLPTATGKWASITSADGCYLPLRASTTLMVSIAYMHCSDRQRLLLISGAMSYQPLTAVQRCTTPH